MPIITTFMYSEGTFNEAIPNGQRLHIVSPLLNLIPAFIPGTLSFSVNFGILDIDMEKEHNIQLKFVNSSNEEDVIVDTNEIPFPIVNDPQMIELPPDMRGIMINVGFQNVVFRTEGTYKTIVYFDGESLGEYPIKVKGKEKLQ